MVSEPILTSLFSLSGHPLSDRYQTTFTYKFRTRVEESRCEKGML